MSTYSLADLLRRWAKGELTADQAISHLLQQVDALSQRLADTEKRLRPVEKVLKIKPYTSL